MTISLRQLTLPVAVLALAASCALPALAQDSRSEDMVRYFRMQMIDTNKDGMVSKTEFMDAMGKAWDMHMAEDKKMHAEKVGAAKAADPKMKDKMTLEQYIEFSKMFGLNIGS